MSHVYEQLTLRRESPALWRVTFSNPPINLVNPDTLVELDALVTELEASEEVKVVVFDSADADFFLAHWDVSPAAQKTRSGAPPPPWTETALRLSKAPVVSIASIRGRARGMGSEFTLACDLRFASRERAVFGQPEVGVGLVPGGGAMERLPSLVGRARALEIVLGAGDFDADMAERYGWINRALPDAALDDFVDALARRIASFDKQALAMAKRLLNKDEAALVRRIFERYCQLGCVQALQEELSQTSTRGRSRLQRDGSTETRAFSRGGLYAVLNRRLYLGEVHHKGESFEGQHEAIVPAALWAKAQAKLQNNRHERRTGKRASNTSLLAGMVADGAGNRLIPTHSTKGDKRYRYYVTRPGGSDKKRLCLPAHDVERIATEQWLQLLSADDLDVQLDIEDPTLSASLRANAERLVKKWRSLDTPEQREILLQANVRVTVNDRRIELSSEPGRLSALLLMADKPLGTKAAPRRTARVIKAVDTSFIKAAGETRILAEEATAIAAAMTPGHKTLLKAIAQGRDWAKALISGEVTSAEDISAMTGLSAAHVARGLKCMSIAPGIVERLVAGKGSSELTWAAVRRLNPLPR